MPPSTRPSDVPRSSRAESKAPRKPRGQSSAAPVTESSMVPARGVRPARVSSPFASRLPPFSVPEKLSRASAPFDARRTPLDVVQEDAVRAVAQDRPFEAQAAFDLRLAHRAADAGLEGGEASALHSAPQGREQAKVEAPRGRGVDRRLPEGRAFRRQTDTPPHAQVVASTAPGQGGQRQKAVLQLDVEGVFRVQLQPLELEVQGKDAGPAAETVEAGPIRFERGLDVERLVAAASARRPSEVSMSRAWPRESSPRTRRSGSGSASAGRRPPPARPSSRRRYRRARPSRRSTSSAPSL